MELSSWLRLAEARLDAAGIESPKLEASVLAAHALRVDRSWLFAHPEHDFNELAGEQLLQRREAQEPLAYILGFREFYGRRFEVSPAVLIPRQDTETLVEAALRWLPESATVLDLGTGSGCVAITLALERRDLHVIASDVSSSALEIAQRNAATLNASVRFLRSDKLKAVGPSKLSAIVTNPPYIGLHEPLEAEVRDHEPSAALFGGLTGYEFIEELLETAPFCLTDSCQLLMEVGYEQASRVAERSLRHGWTVKDIAKDINGVQRVLIVSR